jgi:EAL domain-containing protein (putative c-di-GMP-specific phosphodiesterase class I)
VIVPISTGSLFERTLDEGLFVSFQPIVELRGGERMLFAMEASSRGPDGTIFEDAAAWLEEVRCRRREIVADRAGVSAIAGAATHIAEGTPLSIQVHAATLECDAGFPQFAAEVCDAHGIAVSRLIVGISDHRGLRDAGPMFAAAERLRGLGARIAVDDAGAGGSRLFVELRPDFYKVHPTVVRDCGSSPRSRAILESLAQLAARFGGRVIAQNVESASELETIVAVGIGLLHGASAPPLLRTDPLFFGEAAGVVPDFTDEKVRS